MIDHMPPVRVQQVGDSRFARFILRNDAGRFWTGSGWSDLPGEAVLYLRSADATNAHRRFHAGRDQDGESLVVMIVVGMVKRA